MNFTMTSAGARDTATIRARRRVALRVSARFAAVLFGVATWVLPTCAAKAQFLVQSARIEMPSVEGRLDHLDIDLEGQRLFVAALGAGSVEVIDLAAGRRAARLQPLREPQGVSYLLTSKRLFVASGGGGGVQAFADGKAPVVAAADGLDDADNLRLGPSKHELYVGYAHALAVLDTDTLRVLRRVELPGHPEAFAVEGAGEVAYVNVPGAGQIVVVDLRNGRAAATWNLTDASQNFPLALDEGSHRLLVATRHPALLLVWDTTTGRRVSELPICADADDLFFDAARHLAYAVCGEGQVQVIRQRDADQYAVAERVITAPGARTGLFVPSLSTLYVAVPARDGKPAEVRVFRIP